MCKCVVQLCSGIAGHASLAHPPMSKQSSTPSLFSGAERVTIATVDAMMGEAPFPLASMATRPELGSEKKLPVIDHFSEKAVKISTDLDQIFDSEGEDDVQQVCRPPTCTHRYSSLPCSNLYQDTALLLSDKTDTNIILSGVKTTKVRVSFARCGQECNSFPWMGGDGLAACRYRHLTV